MRILSYLKQFIFFQKIISFLEAIIIPGYNQSVWYLIKMYAEGLQEGRLGNKAAAISWRLFMSLFPFLLFFLILIQYLPYYSVIEQYLIEEIIQNFLPPNVVEIATTYLKERQENISSELENTSIWVLCISMLVFLYISTNGIKSLLRGLHHDEFLPLQNKRKFKQFLAALGLTIFLTLLLILGLLSIYYIDVVLNVLAKENLSFIYQKSLFIGLKYLFFLIIFLVGICMIYYVGNFMKLRFKHILPGAILSTFLFLLITYLFGIYITNFTRYNLLYGSVGSILIVMLGLYLNVILLLIGNELNITLAKTKITHE